MANKFSELRDKMSPERRARADARTKEMLAEMGWTEAERAEIKSIAAKAPPTDDLIAFVEQALASIPLNDQSSRLKPLPHTARKL